MRPTTIDLKAAKRSAAYLLIPLAMLFGCRGKVSPAPEPPQEAKPVAEQVHGELDSSKATVEETVRFIFNHASIAVELSEGRQKLVESTYSLEKENPCHAKIKAKARNDQEIIEIDIDFKLLNPNAIEIFDQQGGYRPRVKVRATNGEDIVKGRWTKADGDVVTFGGLQVSPIPGQYLTLYLGEGRDAKKVEKALRHVISQCGGQEDLFPGEEKASP